MGKIVWKSKKIVQDFRRYAKVWGQYQIPLRTIGQFITEVAKTAIDNEQDPTSGHHWPSLSPVYAAYKRKQRRSSGMLVFRGQLKRGIGYSVTVPRVTVGPSVHYAVHHQFGTRGGSLGRSGASAQGMPARPFMGLSKQDEAEIEKIIAKFISGRET